jgi:hypothetical protein
VLTLVRVMACCLLALGVPSGPQSSETGSCFLLQIGGVGSLGRDGGGGHSPPIEDRCRGTVTLSRVQD